MAIPYGWQEEVQFLPEVNYGEEDTSTPTVVAFRAVSFDLTCTDPPVQLGGVPGVPFGWRYDATRPREMKGVPDVSGSIVLECEYDDLGWLLKNVLGDPTTTGSGPYTHTYTVASTVQDMEDSFTIIRRTGQTRQAFYGCHIDAIEIGATNGEIAKVTVEVVGQTHDNASTHNSAGTLSSVPFLEFHESSIRYHASTGTASAEANNLDSGNQPSSWSWRFEKNLRKEAAAGTADSSNNLVRGIREPVPAGFFTSKLTFSRDWTNDNFYDMVFAEGTAGYGSFAGHFESDEQASGTNYSLDAWFPAGRVISGPTTHGGGADIITEDIEVEAAYGGSSTDTCKVVLVNDTDDYADAS